MLLTWFKVESGICVEWLSGIMGSHNRVSRYTGTDHNRAPPETSHKCLTWGSLVSILDFVFGQ